MNYYELIQKAIEYIERNLLNEIDLKCVAKEAGMSLANFHRLFFALTGHSVLKYYFQ